MNRQTDKCTICESEFYVEALKDGKCDFCNARFPGVKDRAELLKQREEIQNKKFNTGNMDNIITKKVDEILKDYGILQKCDCGNLYFKTSPAKKTCGACPVKEETK